LQQRGAGTQKVEQELAGLFPSAKLLRMDMDTTTRKGSHQRILEKFGSGEADILLGTQMVAKGLDFARVTLVGVISADTQMLLPDFRASERTFQLLTQVAGRAGRSTLKGEVVIQTHQPKHYTLQHVVDHDYRKFVEEELEERKELDYPPLSREDGCRAVRAEPACNYRNVHRSWPLACGHQQDQQSVSLAHHRKESQVERPCRNGVALCAAEVAGRFREKEVIREADGGY
jgi:primosomal protein N'